MDTRELPAYKAKVNRMMVDFREATGLDMSDVHVGLEEIYTFQRHAYYLDRVDIEVEA